MPLIGGSGVGGVFANRGMQVVEALFGDTDGDGVVGVGDLFRFRAAYLTSVGDPGYRADLDIDDDGFIGIPELFAFRQNYEG